MTLDLTHRKSKPLVTMFVLVALAFCLSACRSYNAADDNWAVIAGTAKNVQGTSPHGTRATSKADSLFYRVTFEYNFENKFYEGSQIVSPNIPKHFVCRSQFNAIIGYSCLRWYGRVYGAQSLSRSNHVLSGQAYPFNV